MSGRVAARIAPLDLPQTVRALLEAAAPTRLDIVETEAWPNLILEARRAGVAVVFVSGTVSARTERRLRALGVAGDALFGDGVFALVQDAEAQNRFRALGVPESRVRVTGDLKADLPELSAGPIPPEASRRAVVFGSYRPGEEDALLAIADALERRGVESEPGSRPILVVAPRHAEGAERARHALAHAGYALAERTESDRAMPLSEWIASAASRPGKRAALLATHGELLGVYDHARAAVVGGTFARFGGHSPLEAAARGCPILVGPHHETIADAVHAIAREGGGAIAPDAASAAALAAAWWSDGGFSARSAGARRAAASRAGAAKRGLEALVEWRLTP
jgi:3-deoxy-D-manno-octulosonic-acid transferase